MRGRRGFALVEMLVVTAVLAIRTAFLLPLYLQDWDDCFPSWWLPGPPRPVSGLRLADYALFTWGLGGQGTSGNPYWHWPGSSLTLGHVARPSETCSLMDGYTTTTDTQSLARHGRGMNVAFVDGRMRWLLSGALSRVDTDGSGFCWLHYAAADR